MRQGVMVLVGLVLLAAGGVVGWSTREILHPSESRPAHDADEEPASKIALDDLKVVVSVQPVRKGDLSVTLMAFGMVAAEHASSVTLSSRAGGRLVTVPVVPGQAVAAGAVVATFETAPLEAAVAQAHSVLAAANSAVEDLTRVGRGRQTADLAAAVGRANLARESAMTQRARLEPLHADGLVSDKAWADALTAVALADADVALATRARDAFTATGADTQAQTLAAAAAAAAIALREAEAVLAGATVRAPVAGQIAALSVHVGDKVDAGGALGRLLLPAGRAVVLAVPATAVAGVAAGQLVTVEDAAGRSLVGRVARVSGDVAPAAGTVDVTVIPTAEVTDLRPGTWVSGRIETSHLAGALLVSDRAVTRRDDQLGVMIVGAGDHAAAVAVEIVGRANGVVAVTGALKEGDRVIVDGGYNLPAGAHVEIRAAASRPDDSRPAGDGK